MLDTGAFPDAAAQALQAFAQDHGEVGDAQNLGQRDGDGQLIQPLFVARRAAFRI